MKHSQILPDECHIGINARQCNKTGEIVLCENIMRINKIMSKKNGQDNSLKLDPEEIFILENHERAKNVNNAGNSDWYKATHKFNRRYKDEYYKSLELFKKSHSLLNTPQHILYKIPPDFEEARLHGRAHRIL